MNATYFRIILLILVAFSLNRSLAQVDIVSIDADPYLLRANNLLFGTVQNSGNSGNITIQVIVSTADGRPVVQTVSDPISIGPGVHQVRSLFSGRGNLKYGNSSSANYFRSFGSLPSGQYTYCLEIIPYSDIEFGDEDCQEILSEALSALDLVYPMDGDTIAERRPTLMWTTTEPVLNEAGLEFMMTLTKMEPGGDPYSSIAIDRPIINLPKLRGTTVTYPIDATSLEPGGTYAWQVYKTVAGQIIDETEAWAFTVYKEPIPSPAKYVRIDKTGGSSFYRPVDDRIYFRFDEIYKSDELICTIIAANGSVVEPEVEGDSDNQDKALKAQGINEYELDLLPYDLDKGTYTLKVENEKARTYYLKFIME